MTAPSFLPGRVAVDVLRASLDTEARYGASQRDWATATTTTIQGCAVLPANTDETDVGREYAATHMRLYAPSDADIATTDRVLWRGQTFEVDGPPTVWCDDDGQVHHVEASLKRLAG
jgi:hypothetical protein